MTTTPESADELLREGVAALKMGDRALAMSLLARAVRRDPQSEQAWLYLAGAVTDPAQRRTCLERVLSLNPASAAARQGLIGLGPAPAPAPAPASPPTPAPAPAPLSAPPDRVMPPLAVEPAPARAPEPTPATSTTMRLPPAMIPIAIEPPAKARQRPADRMIWALILILGLMLMLGGAAYAIILLRG